MTDFTTPPTKPDDPTPGAGGPTPPTPPSAAGNKPPTLPVAAATKRSSGWKTLLWVLGLTIFIGSLLANLVLMSLVSLDFGSGGGLRPHVLKSGSSRQVIAVHEVFGPIGSDAAARAEAFYRRVSKDDNVKAVLIRVNSPGGGISACDRIHKVMKQLQDDHNKTLVVSMGSVAASGGYYISASADAIVAEPTTITGSIGVIGEVMTFKGTLDKIGMKVKLLPSTQARHWKAAPNPFEDPEKYQLDELQGIIDTMHKRFEDLVAAERKGTLVTAPITATYTRGGETFTATETEPFNGKIFLAERAEKLGLIDQVGYFDDAIDRAASLAGLDKPKVVAYRRRPTFSDQLGLEGKGVTIDAKLLDEIQTPKVLMMWKVGE